MAVAEIEDLTGTIELVAFPACFEAIGSHLEPDHVLDITAKIDLRNEKLQLICETVTDDLSELGEEPEPSRTVHLSLPVSRDVWADIRMLQSIDQLLTQFEGDDQVVIHLPKGKGRVALKSRKHRVESGEALRRAFAGMINGGEMRIEDPACARQATYP
jgi:DNA polymerase-3 subunit alpha